MASSRRSFGQARAAKRPVSGSWKSRRSSSTVSRSCWCSQR
ncbi:hypothetical protein [Ralstonia sp. SET104]